MLYIKKTIFEQMTKHYVHSHSKVKGHAPLDILFEARHRPRVDVKGLEL